MTPLIKDRTHALQVIRVLQLALEVDEQTVCVKQGRKLRPLNEAEITVAEVLGEEIIAMLNAGAKTHFEHYGKPFPECGLQGPTTANPALVSCRRCLKTAHYQEVIELIADGTLPGEDDS